MISLSNSNSIAGLPASLLSGGAANPDFVSTWDTTKAGSASNTVVLPLLSGGTYSGTIDWGDGGATSVLSYANRTHVYASSGTYTITISGDDIQGFAFNNGGDKAKIIDISNWGNLAFTGSYEHMRGCVNLDITATDAPDISGITGVNFQSFFYDCQKLTTVDFTAWDFSVVTNMGASFGNCYLLDCNLSNADTSNVTSFLSTFLNAGTPNDINSWDVSSATNFSNMFYNSDFNSNIGSWNFASALNVQNMFRNSPFNNGGSNTINNWGFPVCTNFSDMLRECGSFDQPINGWDVSSATNMQNLMYAPTQTIPFDQTLEDWDITAMTNMVNLLRGCALSTANYDATLIGFENTLQAAYPNGSGYTATINVNFGGSEFSSALMNVGEARYNLLNVYGWTISDGGAV